MDAVQRNERTAEPIGKRPAQESVENTLLHGLFYIILWKSHNMSACDRSRAL